MTTADDQSNRSAYIGAAAAIAVILFAGFARNYYLRAWFGTRAITFMVHIHGLVMSAWVVLFVAQTLLVARHRVDLHRKLGSAGACLAAAVLALGVYTIVGSIGRQEPDAGAALFWELFVAFDGISLLVFACLVAVALLNRRRREIHRRLMLVAMLALLPPAYGRLVAYFTHDNVEQIVLGLMYASVLTCVIVDGWRCRRLHPAFILGGLAVLAASQLAYFAQVYAP
jgi:uncharacterized membrane protein YozB (DUF420 family)